MGEAATGRWRADGSGSLRALVRRGGRSGLRRWGRLTVASGLVLLAGPTLAPAAAAAPRVTVTELPASVRTDATARTTGLPAVDPAYPVVVTLNTVTPAAPAPDGEVTLSGTVTNRGSAAIDELYVGLVTTGRPLDSRSEIEALAAPDLTPSAKDGREINSAALQAKVGTLAKGVSAPFTIKAPIAKLGLGSSPEGVYALGVDVRSSGASAGRSLGIARTFLPLHTKSSGVKATKVATIWPLTDAPRIQAQTYLDASRAEQPVLTDDDLTGSLRQDGRLGQLASLGAQNQALHLTWVIDPDLINTVYAMTGSYQVATANDSSGANAACNCLKKGTGSDAASAWLKNLQTALAQGKPDIVSLPFADPDLAALAHNADGRQQVSSLLPQTSSALGLDRLQVDAAHNVAWPYQGYIDSSVTKLAKSMGANQIIVNGAAMPDSDNLNFTPNAARSIGGGMTAVVADGAISKIFSGDLSAQSKQTAATQQFLAETLVISGERPDQQRTVVVQPPRQMSAATAQTLIKALTAAQGGNWVTPTDLNGVVAAGATPGANTTVPTSYPAALKSSEATLFALGNLDNTRAQLDRLQQILTRPDRLREPFGAAMIRSVSTAWRDQPSSAGFYQMTMDGYVRTLLESVKIVPKVTDVVVPGNNSSAQVAVSVENDLEQTVVNLKLELLPGDPTQLSRLRIDSAPVQDVVVAGGRTKNTYRFKVTALANGTAKMQVRLYSTQDPNVNISSTFFDVSITSVSSGVITVIASGGLLVVLAGLRLYWKRKKNAAQEAAAAEGQESEGQESGGQDHPESQESEGEAPDSQDHPDSQAPEIQEP